MSPHGITRSQWVKPCVGNIYCVSIPNGLLRIVGHYPVEYLFIIRVTSHEHHCVSNYRTLDCLFNRLFRLSAKKFESSEFWPFTKGILFHSPAGTRRNNDVFTTSTRRRRRRVDVVKTLSLRHYCVMCPLGVANNAANVSIPMFLVKLVRVKSWC